MSGLLQPSPVAELHPLEFVDGRRTTRWSRAPDEAPTSRQTRILEDLLAKKHFRRGKAEGLFWQTVGTKLALAIKELSSIAGAAKDLQELQDRVEEIDIWLQTVGNQAKRNDQSSNWLKKLKDAAYDTEDLVHEFHMEAEKHDATVADVKNIVVKYLWTKPKSVVFQCKTAHKIKVINKRFDAIVKERSDYSTIANSMPILRSVLHISKTTGEVPLWTNVDETSIVGRDQVKNQIVSKLIDSIDQQNINIVALIGLGGSGKTSLAKLVFNDGNIIKENFEVKLWVHVSREFSVEMLVKKLFEAIADDKPDHLPLQRVSRIISEKLAGKRFLLVLDDVWTENRICWEQFMVHLKCGASGSSILLTSRSRQVAEAVDATHTCDLPFLSVVDSWKVFQQSFGISMEGLDPEFLQVGTIRFPPPLSSTSSSAVVAAAALSLPLALQPPAPSPFCHLVDADDTLSLPTTTSPPPPPIHLPLCHRTAATFCFVPLAAGGYSELKGRVAQRELLGLLASSPTATPAPLHGSVGLLKLKPLKDDGDIDTIVVAPGTDYTQSVDPTTGVIVISFGTIFSGESRKVILTLTLKNSTVTTSRYDAELADAQNIFTAQGKRHVTGAPEAELAPRAEADAIRQARLKADAGDLDEARYTLVDAQSALEHVVLSDGQKLVKAVSPQRYVAAHVIMRCSLLRDSCMSNLHVPAPLPGLALVSLAAVTGAQLPHYFYQSPTPVPVVFKLYLLRHCCV
nr:unnamed protein product [Digitaria exilis]